MANELNGAKVAFITSNEGIEEAELTEPWKAVERAGGRPVLIAPESGQAQAFHHLDRAGSFPVDVLSADADPDDYDALVLPGGVANGDQVRTDPESVRLVRHFFESGKPVAAIRV